MKRFVAVIVISVLAGLSGAVPTDNPVATFYDDDAGYPAWTDRIAWSRVIDMKSYAVGKTHFEKFENARDELAGAGGGILYYPAGTYDFSEGPFDGPAGRGLMLREGVVIRGEAPEGKPMATKGALHLPTRFILGFERRENAIDAGDRLTLVLEDGEIRVSKKKGRIQTEPAELCLSFGVRNGRILRDVKAFRRGYGRDVWTGKAMISQNGDVIKISVGLDLPKENEPKKAAYEISLTRKNLQVTGTYSGTCRGYDTEGSVEGRFLHITPETPRTWNLLGLMPEKGRSIKDVDTVGIAWVHLVGATIYFGAEVDWGGTWASANSWKSLYAQGQWAARKPDGTHPWDPLVGGGKQYVGAGDGRLVFGCVLQDAAVLNEGVSMGRPDYVQGFGQDGFYMYKFGPRIGVYGSRVLVANNRLPMSRGRNFKYEQTTRRTFPHGGGAGMGFDPPRKSTVFFDYNKSAGVDINKTLLGLTKNSPTGKAGKGYFSENVVVLDNYVYNNGHKGFNVSGKGVTLARNHNERQMLKEGWDPERICGWELTLDGHLESSPGGNGAISDNLSRAFDLAGKQVWVHRNTFNNLGSSPGNDGEGILCQAHGGSQIYSWAVTYNHHTKGHGQTGYIGGWDVHMAGALFGWNALPGWIGSINVGKRTSTDVAFVGNRAGGGVKPMKGAQVGAPGGRAVPPRDVKAVLQGHDAALVTWADAGNNEVGFRVDRKIDKGAWTTIAYRPPRITGHKENPQHWIDYLAPRGRSLVYRVVSLNEKDNDEGTERATRPLELP